MFPEVDRLTAAITQQMQEAHAAVTATGEAVAAQVAGVLAGIDRLFLGWDVRMRELQDYCTTAADPVLSAVADFDRHADAVAAAFRRQGAAAEEATLAGVRALLAGPPHCRPL